MPQLRLDWSRTWADQPRDFNCRTPEGQQVGRIFYDRTPSGQAWYWFWACNGAYRGRLLSTTGKAGTKDEAARAVEQAWFDALARIDAALDG